MTAEELTAAQAKINDVETEAAQLQQGIHEGVAKARQINNAVRAGIENRNALLKSIEPLKAAVAAHVAAANKAAKAGEGE